MRGLETSDTRKLVRFFGKRMGLNFDETAITYLQNRYGGHPLLMRMACSYTHFRYDPAKIDRPIAISQESLARDEKEREVDILPYGRHVVSEIRDFYPDEYALLELLASGQSSDYWELSAEPEWVRHIQAYGIVSSDRSDLPRFLIPVLENYISAEARKKAGAPDETKFAATSDRVSWLKRRIDQIVGGHRSLETSFAQAYGTTIYPGGSLSEADRMPSLTVCMSLDQLNSYSMQLYRSLVEPVYKSGKYTYGDKLPNLDAALENIRIVRHHFGHKELRPEIQKRFQAIISSVTKRSPAVLSEDDAPLLQQFLTDGLFLAIQIELQKLS